MPRSLRPIGIFMVVSAALATTVALSQSTYDEALLAVKRQFARNEIAALAEPFTGVAASSGVVSGLFPIRASGVSTEPIRRAAASFLTTLTPEQQIRTVFAVDNLSGAGGPT